MSAPPPSLQPSPCLSQVGRYGLIMWLLGQRLMSATSMTLPQSHLIGVRNKGHLQCHSPSPGGGALWRERFHGGRSSLEGGGFGGRPEARGWICLGWNLAHSGWFLQIAYPCFGRHKMLTSDGLLHWKRRLILPTNPQYISVCMHVYVGSCFWKTTELKTSELYALPAMILRTCPSSNTQGLP